MARSNRPNQTSSTGYAGRSKRGLASASLETRRQVASLGGQASRGGGRTRNVSSR